MFLALAVLVSAVMAGAGVMRFRQERLLRLADASPVRPSVRSLVEDHAVLGRTHILLVGDSRVSGWPLPKSGGARWSAWGFSGHTTTRILPSLQGRDVPTDVTAVYVQAGVNDLVAIQFMKDDEATPANQAVLERLKRIVCHLRASGAPAVVLTTVVRPLDYSWHHRLVWGRSLEAATADFNRSIRRLQDAGLRVLDLDALLAQESVEGRRSRHAFDPLHWSSFTYERATRALLQDMQSSPGNTGMAPAPAFCRT